MFAPDPILMGEQDRGTAGHMEARIFSDAPGI
jgi:hypothetical protein